MAQVFVSYSRTETDAAAAQKIVALLESHNWSVWWDQKLRAGENYHNVIEREIEAAACVVVLWSENSRTKEFVQGEATTASSAGTLVPVRIDSCNPPVGFRALQTLDLSGWKGGRDDRADNLIASVADKIGDDVYAAKPAIELSIPEASLPSLPENGSQRTFKYRAFIANTHADDEIAERVRLSLASFRVPASLVGTPTSFGPLPRRLTPIYRLAADLMSTFDLRENLERALAESSCLIVVCSPRSAKSPWVNREIELYRELHGSERIFPIIIDGEPYAAGKQGQEAGDECFPPALLASDQQPIAVDARPKRDGFQRATLKLAAGILGVGLDDLVQRERKSRARRSWAAVWVTTLIVLNIAQAIVIAGFLGLWRLFGR